MKQKILTLFVALICATQLFAYDAYIDGIYYNLDESAKTAEVTNETGSYHAQSYSGVVVIPPTITYNSQTYSVTTIGSRAFEDCTGLTSVTIGNSVTTIGYEAFYGCTGLTSVTIPNSVTTIGDYAFRFCDGLTSVTIGNSVTTIGYEAFYGCSGLTSINVDSANTHYCSIDGVLFNYAKDTLIQYPASNPRTEYTIPNSVTMIGEWAFYNCTSLISITIPNSVITIGSGAFYDCTEVKSIMLSNSVTTIGENAFRGCCRSKQKQTIIFGNSIKKIGAGAFDMNGEDIELHITDMAAWCKIKFGDAQANPLSSVDYFYLNNQQVQNLVIPNTVDTINAFAFYGAPRLQSLIIPNSVTTIGKRAFHNCSSLTSVTIGASVTMIEESAFDYDYHSNLAITNYTGTISDWCKIKFSNAGANPIYNSHNFYINNVEVKDLIIPNDVTIINKYAFCDCIGLISVALPNDISSIRDNAFSGCSSIEEVYVYVPNPYPFETKDPVVIVNPIITQAFTATTPQYVLQNVAHISTDNTPTCVLVHVDLSKMETSQYAKLALDFAGTKYELSTKESTVILTGLTPASTNQATFYSQLIGDSQWREGATIEISTGDLALTTLTPKVVSAGTAIVAAETNISDYETNVGFEWRKYDAPSTMPSKSGGAIICNGIMEGKLLNLGTDSYWNVRPYYEAADGTRYYDEWITFDPSDFSYFEPTVHTYALATSPTANKVQVRGYVMTGTDDVTEQGFEYWFNGSDKSPRRMPSATPDSIYRVTASGQVMTAVLEDLAYSTTYTCRAYAVAGGETYYGEEVQFLTPEDPRPIYTLSVIAGENGSVNETVAGQYREGEQVTLIATPDEGYTFKEWSDGTTDNPYTITIMNDTTLTATFEELSEGIDEVMDCQESQVESQKVIHNGILYIRRNGKTYNALGGRVK